MVSTNPAFNRPNNFHWLDADAYLFDIDGTLLNTRDLVHWNALHQAMLEAYGIDATIAGIQYHGKTDLGILRAAMTRAGVNRDKFDAGLAVALAVVRREVAANAAAMKPEVCAAIPDMLSRLQSGGKLLGVASGNLEAVGWQKIAAAGMKEFFSFGCFSDHSEMREEIFRNAVVEVGRRLGGDSRTCFIGDTPDDIVAAQKAGAKVIAVCTGTFKLAELSGLNPDLCVSSCGELFAGETCA